MTYYGEISNMEILVFNKDQDAFLAHTLTLSEYKCRCDHSECTRTLVLASTVKSFICLRRAFNQPIQVNSAFRCQIHNKSVGGLSTSFHQIGAAVDLAPGSKDREDGEGFKERLDRLEELAILYFDTVIRYERFVHCHNISDEFRQTEQ